jgi:nucleoside-diphosphate-sugar epimerase
MSAARLDRAVVSGAGGFVGRSLVSLVRGAIFQVHLGEDDWMQQVRAADYAGATVFHLAARVHDLESRREADYRLDNVEKTRAFAQAAAEGGAKRFVFLSSIKVNGEETRARPFRAQDPPAPEDAYGCSKWQAEQELARIVALDIAIVRSPLVYGAGVKGNLLKLLRLADSRMVLPFAALVNRRSFIHVDDLARLLVQCGTDHRASGRTFMAAHAEAASTTRLVATMRRLMQRPQRLAKVPAPWLELAATLAGQGPQMRRLTRSLQADATATTDALGWSAQIGFDTSVEDMTRAYRESLA